VWLVHVNDWIHSTLGATWSGSRIEIASWVFDSDGEQDDSDSYWNISRKEERAGKKLNRTNFGEGRRFSEQEHLLLLSIVLLSFFITCVNIIVCDQTMNTVGACMYIRLYAYLMFFCTYTVCIMYAYA
jgi:hypothetical protein